MAGIRKEKFLNEQRMKWESDFFVTYEEMVYLSVNPEFKSFKKHFPEHASAFSAYLKK